MIINDILIKNCACNLFSCFHDNTAQLNAVKQRATINSAYVMYTLLFLLPICGTRVYEFGTC